MLVIRDTVSDLDCCLGTSAHRSTQTANKMQSVSSAEDEASGRIRKPGVLAAYGARSMEV